MPRIKNTRDTLIYWIFDTRPEKMAIWPFGEPFYCGKTVHRPAHRLHGHRLHGHRRNAVLWPSRSTSKRLIECGEHLTVTVMEIVPAGGDWVTREKHWIAMLRASFGGTNIADGGGGVPGYIPSADAVARTRAAKIGKPRSAETRAKLSTALKGRRLSPEHAAKFKNRVFSIGTRTKMSVASAGRTLSPEARAKISASKVGKPRSAETCAKVRATHLGKTLSEDHIAKIRSANTGKKRSTECRAAMSERMKGHNPSAETRTKMSLAKKGIARGPYRPRSRVALRGV